MAECLSLSAASCYRTPAPGRSTAGLVVSLQREQDIALYFM